jgi:16S rRNA (cytosine1402-N4)-methyltransferase
MHIPVMCEEVVKYIGKNGGKIFVDATLGCGGHTEKILQHYDTSFVIGFDWDIYAIKYCEKKLQQYISANRLKIINESYVNIPDVLKTLKIPTVDGILFDLGMSTLQLKSSRGFSFEDENLDMRMSENFQFQTAKEIVNTYSPKELLEIFYNYGEERYAKIVVKSICEYRKNKSIDTAKELSEIIKKSLWRYYKNSRIHPATKIFQAIRIFINNELNNIDQGVKNALKVLSSKGVCIVISYHSLEDRIIKNIFKTSSGYTVLTKKPLTPTKEEIYSNPSSRSAKVRAIERL